jgi:hypothetical protein
MGASSAAKTHVIIKKEKAASDGVRLCVTFSRHARTNMQICPRFCHKESSILKDGGSQ